MPQRVYNNIEGQRIFDTVGGTQRIIEDVTKVGLPNIKRAVTELKNIAGMAMDVNMPTLHYEAMDFTLYHNNGINCRYLSAPEKHIFDIRTVRQRYNNASGEIEHESVKFRITASYTETEKGDLENGSPYGSTEKYSVFRYEEEVDGAITTIIDAMAGVIKYNGIDYSDSIEKFLA